MKKISLVTVVAIAVLLIASAVPAVSAEMLSDIDSETISFTTTPTNYYNKYHLRVNNIAECRGLYFVYAVVTPTPEWGIPTLTANPYYESPVTLKVGSTIVGHGTAYYNALYTNNVVTKAQIWMEIDDFDPQLMTGAKEISIIPSSGSLFNEFQARYDSTSPGSIDKPIGFGMNTGTTKGILAGSHIVKKHFEWHNEININDDEILLTRNVNGIGYWSNLTVEYNGVVVRDTNINDISIPYVGVVNWTVVNGNNRVYTGSYGSPIDGEEESSELKIYIQNSQTGALIANAQIDISASVNGTLHEVVNKTIPSGIYSIELQPTGGGMPNPDYYRIEVTANGYVSQMPYLDIDLPAGVPTSITFGLDPIAGGPEDENKTFIDFFVRDMSANPISGATVKFGGYTMITNSAGYAVLEVGKNATYTYTVSKSGYGPLTGNVVIGADPRHTINTVLAPAVTPTTPTPIPTSTSISPTPTMTAPTGEPVSNWLDWFAAHFGMILGGGVEIGKIFMWLCFSVPVGVYVAKEAKAGAAGFMAGAGIVTLFFVIIGWVPIWLLVLLALIIGLLYAKVFNNSDIGGGR